MERRDNRETARHDGAIEVGKGAPKMLWQAPRFRVLATIDETESGGGPRSDTSVWGSPS